jgi:hypothetical protein
MRAHQWSLRVAFLLVAPLLMMTQGAAETPKVSVAEADNGCSYYAATLISRTESRHAQQLPDWKFKCEHHPIRSTCTETVETIEAIMHTRPPLKCQ